MTRRGSKFSGSTAKIVLTLNSSKHRNIKQIQISPGSSRHGNIPYVKISTGDYGKSLYWKLRKNLAAIGYSLCV
ncbi:MAG: hypothetical protein IJS52_10170 [Bacilli bacterium]|nr:hypothetical protein [Bacilli bacterium]